MHDVLYEGWLEEVRKVAYVMEDVVDEYLYLVGQDHDIGCCFYLKKGFRRPRFLLSLSQVAFKVKEIEKDLTHLSETKNRRVPMINNGDTSSSNYIVKRSQDLANISRSLDEDLVGVDKNREKLEQWLAGDGTTACASFSSFSRRTAASSTACVNYDDFTSPQSTACVYYCCYCSCAFACQIPEGTTRSPKVIILPDAIHHMPGFFWKKDELLNL